MVKEDEGAITTANFVNFCPLVTVSGFNPISYDNGVIINLPNPNLTDARTGEVQKARSAGTNVILNICHKECKFYDSGQLFGYPIGRNPGTCIPKLLTKRGNNIIIQANVDQPPQPKKKSSWKKMLSFLK